MLEHQDDFQPYMEDDENFGAYCKRMSKVSSSSPWRAMGMMACTHLVGSILHQQQAWCLTSKISHANASAR